MINLMRGDCLERMKEIPDGSVDLVVTSPPYDNLRTYNDGAAFTHDKFKTLANELKRTLSDGGVLVWIVNDATVKGSESGTSFKQALYFKEIGLNLHDTMIYYRGFSKFPDQSRYGQSFEYMFVLSKGAPRVFNPLQEVGNNAGKTKKITDRNADGTTSVKSVKLADTKTITNVWLVDAGYMRSTKYKPAYEHPAIFPEALVEAHIRSWSNPGDVVLDPFLGSGTTGAVAVLEGRKFIGIEMDEKYFAIAEQRIYGALPVEEAL